MCLSGPLPIYFPSVKNLGVFKNLLPLLQRTLNPQSRSFFCVSCVHELPCKILDLVAKFHHCFSIIEKGGRRAALRTRTDGFLYRATFCSIKPYSSDSRIRTETFGVMSPALYQLS